MALRRIGILGGMGPEATILLMQKVVKAVSAHDDADHIPLLVDQNPQVPSRIQRLIEGTGEDPAPVLAQMAARLQAAGAQALAMPCNTAHHYASTIRAAAGIPFLDMVALSVDHAAQLAGEGSRIGVLASPAVRRVGLLDAALQARGLSALYPTNEAVLLEAIRKIKAFGPDAVVSETLRAVSADLLANGAEIQMIACTEFSLIATATAPGVRSFDTLDRLTAAIVRFSQDGHH